MAENSSHLLARVAAGVSVTNCTIRWFGEQVLPRAITGSLNDDELVQTLASVLYSCFYCVSQPLLRAEIQSLNSSGPNGSIADQLALFNPGIGRVESQWICRSVDKIHDTVAVERNGLTLSVSRSRVERDGRDGDKLSIGEPLLVRTPAGSLNRSAGFYVAHSDLEFDYSKPISRIYANTSPETAPRILRDVCSVLNEARLPFDFKVAKDLRQYYRSDVAVLYVLQRDYAHVLAATAPVFRRHRRGLRAAVPALVLQLDQGLGAADDPGNGRSFGMDRCTMISAALTKSRDQRDAQARLQAIEREFSNHGISLAEPHAFAVNAGIYARRI